MGRRKKKRVQEDELIWCYYCDRIFKDEATLITHQKAKHYRCSACNKKMNTAQGLQVHCEQVHKLNVDRVPGAKPGRDSMDIEIFGMAGVPEGMRPGGVFEEPRHSSKKVATEANNPSGGAASNSTPPSYAQANVQNPTAVQPPHYQMPTPQAPVAPGGYAAPQYGMFYGLPPPPGMYRPPHMMPPQAQLAPGAPIQFRMPGIPPPIPPPGLPPQSPPGVIQPPHMPQGPPGTPMVPMQAAEPPAGGALFPIVPTPGSAPVPGVAPLGTGSSVDHLTAPPQPQSAPAPQPQSASTPASAELDLLWKDEAFSMEERRAQQPKYAEQAQGNGSGG